jgi:hypothetical protein
MTAPAITAPSSAREDRAAVRLTLTPVSAAVAALTEREPASWTAADFCLYVTEEITRIHGPQLPCEEPGRILEAFCMRFGIPDAVRIARAAFEVHAGMWHGAPVTVRRFQAGHDDFFSGPLLTSCS